MFQKNQSYRIAGAVTASFLLLSGSIAGAQTAQVSGAETGRSVIEAVQVAPFGTDSKGSYSYEAGKKKEGSKSKKPGAGFKHGKSEGSKSKKYSGGHGYTPKKPEGSGKKAHPKRHGYSHRKPEGSDGGRGKSYGHGGHTKPSPFAHVLKFRKKLGLTEDQVKKIKDREFEFKKMKIQTKADHTIAHMDLDRLVHSGTLDEAAMRAIADRIVAIKSKKIHAAIEAKIFILKTLTAEQRKKISQLHSAH